MKAFIHLILAITGLVCMVFLSFYLFAFIIKFISEPKFETESISQFLMGIFGVLGLIGMVLLFLEDRVNKRTIIFCLSAGTISCFLFIIKSLSVNWFWMLSRDGLIKTTVILWPTLVSIYSIFRLIFNRSL